MIKIDVEGAELEVIAGLGDLGNVEHLFVECNARALRLAGHTPDHLVAAIETRGLRNINVIDEFHAQVTAWPPNPMSLYTNLHCTR